MRSTGFVLAIALAITTPGCTLVGIGVASGTTAIHNTVVDEPDAWGYRTPIVIGAVVGLIADIVFVKFLAHQWSKPMT